jgi:YD repeat-containing protein
VEASVVEEKTLYEKGVERRRTVTAVDSAGAIRYSETVEADGSRRTERYDVLRRLVEERSTGSDGAGETIRYSWAGDRLLGASAFPVAADGTVGAEALWTDAYRYLRSGALLSVTREGESSVFTQRTERAVPRVLETRSSDGSSMRTVYDAAGRVSEVLRYGSDGASVPAEETIVYGEGGKRAGPSVTSRKEGDATVETERNEAGRIVRETRYGPDKAVREETRTEWAGDRVGTVRVVSGALELRTEYGYDAEGRRVSEKNYRNGKLERSVRIDGSAEVEELYRNGAVALRSYYEGGALVREERLK